MVHAVAFDSGGEGHGFRFPTNIHELCQHLIAAGGARRYETIPFSGLKVKKGNKFQGEV